MPLLPLLATLLAPPPAPSSAQALALDFAAVRARDADALAGRPVVLRVERDSLVEQLPGRIGFDCAGPEDLHRTVHLLADDPRWIDPLPWRLTVAGRLRVLRHAGFPAAGIPPFVELRLESARVVSVEERE